MLLNDWFLYITCSFRNGYLKRQGVRIATDWIIPMTIGWFATDIIPYEITTWQFWFIFFSFLFAYAFIKQAMVVEKPVLYKIGGIMFLMSFVGYISFFI